MAAQNAGSTRAKGLEEMTVSMLLGEEGLQKQELKRMVDWLKNEAKPFLNPIIKPAIHIHFTLLIYMDFPRLNMKVKQ